jgi:hypothetical protein
MPFRIALAVTSSVMLFFPAGPRPPAEDQAARLKVTLEKLDEASKRFLSAEAHVTTTSHDHLIPEDDVQNGEIYFARKDGSTEMGYRIAGKYPTIITYKNGSVTRYECKTLHGDTITRAGLETYLTLGFGGSGADLAKAWNITDLGQEALGGVSVEKLRLIPKDSAVKANISSFTIWVDLTRGISLKQVRVAPTDDVQTAVYTIGKYNKVIDTKPFEVPAGCK